LSFRFVDGFVSLKERELKKLAFIFCLLVHSTNGLLAQCVERNFAFSSNEEVYYDVYYNWGFIWISAGEVFFKVHDAVYQDRPVYFLHSYGKSLKRWDWFFKVRDTYKAYIDKETLLPYYFLRQTSEGGYEVDSRSDFDYHDSRVISVTKFSNKPTRHDTLHLPSCTFDVLSMIYYARNIDFSSYSIDDKIPIKCLIDGEIFDLYIRYLGTETIQTRNKETYRCIKFKPLLVEGTIFTGGEDMTVWVTDDHNRIPVLVEAKVLVGSIKAFLKDARGLRNETSSRMPD
jgi:hypothetical protein